MPIILCGGINGGGKTTLLDAIQLVLYGKRAKCSKRGERSYDDFLRDSIHRGANPCDAAAIELSFRYATEGQEHLYDVTRSWEGIRGRIRETVRVCRDGEVDGWLSDNWNQVVEELIPFGIAQLCFFDAEKIRFLAEDETSSEALGAAIKSLLGLDLVERLVADAGVLEARLAKRGRKSADREQVERLELDLQRKQAEIDNIVQEKGALENGRLAGRQSLTKAEDRFAKIGGLHWEQRESRQRTLIELEHSVREGEVQLVGLAGTELPLLLILDLLNDVWRQSELESTAANSRAVAKLLDQRDAGLVKLLNRKRVAADVVAIVDDYLAKDRNQRAANGDVGSRLQLSEGGRRMLAHLLDRGLAEKQTASQNMRTRVEAAKRSWKRFNGAWRSCPTKKTFAKWRNN